MYLDVSRNHKIIKFSYLNNAEYLKRKITCKHQIFNFLHLFFWWKYIQTWYSEYNYIFFLNPIDHHKWVQAVILTEIEK